MKIECTLWDSYGGLSHPPDSGTRVGWKGPCRETSVEKVFPQGVQFSFYSIQIFRATVFVVWSSR